MAILVKTKTPEQDKDFWATSWQAFWDAESLYGREFQLDVAAEPLTTKCSRYYTAPEYLDKLLSKNWRERAKNQLRAAELLGNACVGLDSLNINWVDDWWCNPPFTMKMQFIAKARKEQKAGRPGMMLLPYEPLTGWWRELLSGEVIIYEPDGRYQFLERDGETMKQGANFGSVLVLFPTHKIGQSIRVPFKRGVSGE